LYRRRNNDRSRRDAGDRERRQRLGEPGQRGDADFRQSGRQRGQVRSRNEMRGEPGVHRVGAGRAQAGQAQIDAELAGQPRQEERAADVGEEADRGFRHGEHRVLGRDAVRAVHGHADAAAHADAVDQRDIWLGVGRDQQVEAYSSRKNASTLVRSPDSWPSRRARMSPPAQKARSPAPSTTTAWTCGSSAKSCSAPVKVADHVEGQRVQDTRAVEQDAPDPAVAAW
jgi:hypothetical protein